jgi:hypothetical protein
MRGRDWTESMTGRMDNNWVLSIEVFPQIFLSIIIALQSIIINP